MSDAPSAGKDPDPGGDRPSTTSGAAPAMPRWVKGFVIAGAVLALLVVVALLVGGGHGPGRHGPGLN